MAAFAGPTFLGIGAQKTGTTWLHRMLSRHPDVGMPEQKELHFWDGAEPDAAALQGYSARFAGLRGRARGEITPSYAILPPARIALIRSRLPALRLVYLVRDPRQRAWSQAAMELARHVDRLGREPADLPGWLAAQLESPESLARGNYALCLDNWLQHYPREQLQVSVYEEAFAAPRGFLKACAAHLGVDPAFYDGIADAELGRAVLPEQEILGIARRELPAELRTRHAALLERLYAPRIAALERLLGRDLKGIWTGADAR